MESNNRREAEPTRETEHLEQEISLLNPPSEFEQNLISKGAKLKQEKRRLIDFRYSLPEEAKVSQNFDSKLFLSSDAKVTALFNYLGYTVTKSEQEGSLIITNIEQLANKTAKTIRLRKDGGDFFFTIKGPAIKDVPAAIKVRPEYEIEITETGHAELMEFLNQNKYAFNSEVQKDRTSLILDKSAFDGNEDLAVEIDAFPPVNNKTFSRAELEGNAGDIQKALIFLSKENIFNGETSNAGQTELLKAALDFSNQNGPLILKFEDVNQESKN